MTKKQDYITQMEQAREHSLTKRWNLLIENPIEVADIQIVIKALSHQCQIYRDIIKELQLKIKRQKEKISDLESNLTEGEMPND